jgi:hypothetical protein
MNYRVPELEHRDRAGNRHHSSPATTQAVVLQRRTHHIPLKVLLLEPRAIMLSGMANPRQAAAQLMNFGLIVSTAFMVRCKTPLFSSEESANSAADVERPFRYHRLAITYRRRSLG